MEMRQNNNEIKCAEENPENEEIELSRILWHG